MSVLDDIAGALDSYPADEVALTFVNVNPPGSVVDVNEIVPFQVRIENNGHINMTGVTLHVHSFSGALVSTAQAGPFTSSLAIVSGLTVNGGGSRDTATLYFKAPATTKPEGTQLLSAHIENWSGNFDHYFSNHTNNGPTPAGGIYESAVSAD
jgi:hypothetical protein